MPKTNVEASWENILAKKTRKPQLIDSKPTFKSTSERYKKKFLIRNLIKIEDKIRVAKAIEKNNKVEEI